MLDLSRIGVVHNRSPTPVNLLILEIIANNT